jgi:hypothetical protein
MKKHLLLLSAVVAVALALVAGPAAAGTKTSATGSSSATATVVHGIPGLLVDVYVVNNFQRQRLDNVAFTAVAALKLRPGFAYIAILPADDSKFSKPLYQKFLWLKGGENLSIAAHLSTSGAPAFSVFKNDVSNPGDGKARVIVRHLAAAPAVDILAGTTAVIEDLTNPNEKAIVVPGGTYQIAVAPANNPVPVWGPNPLTFVAGTTTIVYAVGSLGGGTFTPLVQVF